MNEIREHLAYVHRVVADSRRAARVDARPLLAWSVLTAGAGGISYLYPAVDSPWLWAVVIGLAWAYTGWRWLLRQQRETTELFSHRALNTLWFALLTAMTLAGFGGYAAGLLPAHGVTPLMACFLGAACLASSALMQWRSVAWLALAWWLSAGLLVALPEGQRMAAFSIAMLLWLTLPVVILIRRGAR